MQRSIDLAKLGEGFVAPNPMVGAVLVYINRIIGEGYHQQYGESHAEVNCIASVKEVDQQFIRSSTLYVTLEPCAHFGKTPPCADLIIKHKIPVVVVGCRDPFKAVDGKGIEKLKTAGVDIVQSVLEKECKELNKRFFTFHTQHRPYIILKWAETADGKIAESDYGRIFISNNYSNRMVHKWRHNEAAILVGTNTALHDDPSLTNRLWTGQHPVRVVVDMDLRLPSHLKLFDKTTRTIVFNAHREEDLGNLLYYRLEKNVEIVHQILNALYTLNVQSVIIEGGARLLQTFIDNRVFDEAYVIKSKTVFAHQGIGAPVLPSSGRLIHKNFTDEIFIFKKPANG